MDRLERILYVEDEPDIRAVARLALETVGGFTILECASGEEALAGAEAFGPQLMLLDVMMPVMDGPTTLAALRERPSLVEVPAVFMTAKVQPNEVDRYRRLGAVGVIPKPFDPMRLADQIREIWAEATRAEG
ncbi:MAG: response regulator [Gemmatimonadetes bacterium]|nr:MAG: response regulator [Gemmatimonadota bacterium]